MLVTLNFNKRPSVQVEVPDEPGTPRVMVNKDTGTVHQLMRVDGTYEYDQVPFCYLVGDKVFYSRVGV